MTSLIHPVTFGKNATSTIVPGFSFSPLQKAEPACSAHRMERYDLDSASDAGFQTGTRKFSGHPLRDVYSLGAVLDSGEAGMGDAHRPYSRAGIRKAGAAVQPGQVQRGRMG